MNDLHNSNDPIILIYDNNNKNENLNKLIESLNKFNYRYSYIGNGDVWEGFGTKIVACKKFYEMFEDPEQIFVQLDARDVLAVNNLEVLKKRINQKLDVLDKKIIVSADSDIFIFDALRKPPGSLIDKDTLTRKSRTYDYNHTYHHRSKWVRMFNKKLPDKRINKINAGMVIGRVKNLLRVFNVMNIDKREDDQLLLYEIFNIKPDLIEIDTDSIFFKNFLYITKRDRYDRNIKIEACFAHTPGHYWKCYEDIYKRIVKGSENDDYKV